MSDLEIIEEAIRVQPSYWSRQMFELIREAHAKECGEHCNDAAQWPEPVWFHDLDGIYFNG